MLSLSLLAVSYTH